MKKWILLFTLSALNLHLFAQGDRAISLMTDVEDSSLKFSTKNDDYCEYYVSVDLSRVIGFRYARTPYKATVQRGTHLLLTLKWDGSQHTSTQIYYKSFRGNPNKVINTDFLYALPVRTGDSVTVASYHSDNLLTFRFDLTNAGDTIYASRGGIVCSDHIFDTSVKGYNKPRNIITISHADGSFGEYTEFTEPLVSPGRKVKMGDPIALSQKNNKFYKFVNFSVYFLDKNKLELEIANKHTHFTPRFATKTIDKLTLEPNTTYVSSLSDEMLMQDMSNREKKKFLKSKK